MITVYDLEVNRSESGPDYRHMAFFTEKGDAQKAGEFYKEKFKFDFDIVERRFEFHRSFVSWANKFEEQVRKDAIAKLTEFEVLILDLENKKNT